MCLLRGIGCRWLVAAVLMVRAGVPAQPIAGANPPDSLKPRLGASPGRAGRTAHLGTQGPLPRARVDVGISKGQGVPALASLASAFGPAQSFAAECVDTFDLRIEPLPSVLHPGLPRQPTRAAHDRSVFGLGSGLLRLGTPPARERQHSRQLLATPRPSRALRSTAALAEQADFDPKVVLVLQPHVGSRNFAGDYWDGKVWP
jgi:hypothetical protein